MRFLKIDNSVGILDDGAVRGARNQTARFFTMHALIFAHQQHHRAVFALAELDPAFTDRVILLADHRDGKALSTRDGPFQIIVPGEKKHARWVRQVIRLKVGRG